MKKLPPAPLFVVLIFLAWRLPSPAAVSCDIIPKTWVTGVGGDYPREVNGDETALILPSYPGAAPARANHEEPQFLTKDNRIPAGPTSYSLSPFARKGAGAKGLFITVWRGEEDGKQTSLKENRTSPRLRISADSRTVAAIRFLSWDEFRALQEDFAQWLLAQNKSRCLFDAFKKPINGFRGFEATLEKFWRKTLATASFDAFIAARKDYFGSSLVRKTSTDANQTAGKNMGAIPLPPGSRLAIHWGSTAVYGYLGDNVTRQTTTGTSYVSITREKGAAKFSPFSPFSVTAIPTVKGRTAVPEGSPVDVSAKVISRVLPFGGDNRLLNLVLPVYNEFDLHNAEIFNPAADSAAPAQLVLLVPAVYTKSDAGDNPTYSTQDASGRERITGTETVDESLYRRFAIWGVDRVFSRESLDQKDFELTKKQTHRPLVFGNQTWIDVEVPVSLSGQIHWIGLKTSMKEFIARYAPWLLLPPAERPAQAPLLRFVRLVGATDAAPADTDHLVDFRIWMPLGKRMDSIELSASDCFLFNP